MNAAIRAVVRIGRDRGFEVFGVERGFAGLLGNDIRELVSRDVSGIIQRGGTFLGTARCPEFETESGRNQALDNMSARGIDSLVVIGGNGSQQGSHALSKAGFKVIGVASTIDNDLCGSDETIGVDTALNIALEAIDRLKVTASSHQRGLVVETMGRDCGYLALMAGITGGAEAVAVPERETSPEQIAELFTAAYRTGKKHALAVVAEGAKCNARTLTEYFGHADVGFQIRATILGHVQRGGTPTSWDRLLGTRLGAGAIEALTGGRAGCLVGLIDGKVRTTPLDEVAGRQKPLNLELLDLQAVLS
jgi:6-phosphofructokinase 1